jgi:Papain-like cysteine protease AvrRpt2
LVAAAVPGFHAIVVTGLYSDGTDDDTFVRINDPWDRNPGTPGAPGGYLNTHDHGSQYVLSLQQFANEYETLASTSMRISIAGAPAIRPRGDSPDYVRRLL